VLLRLLAQPGEMVPKEALVQTGWPDVAVTDNSLERAISILRRLLDAAPGTSGGVDRASAIETVPRRGYRFTGAVTREEAKPSDADLDALLAPHRAWLEGRAALETLAIHNVVAAERAFMTVLDNAPHHASAHVGLANARLFRFEASRVDEMPDVAALAAAVPHAREACRIDPKWGEAWATLGFVLHRVGQIDHGIAAMRRAVELEPDNWRHQFRLAFITWGEPRLRAAQRTLQLMPGLAMAHWLAASVYVARQAFDSADAELLAGTTAQDEQGDAKAFGSVGLHWLAGLLRLRHGDTAGAQMHFDRELTFEHAGHLYARECAAGTWYAKGSLAFHQADRAGARAAFAEVMRRVPRHPLALAAVVGLGDADRLDLERRLETAAGRGAHVDVAVSQAVCAAAQCQSVESTPVIVALQSAPAGPSGWFLPVEPLLRPAADSSKWSTAFALLRSRAG
jgi:tetratricopeptide (TPR) repeat protein